MYRIRAFRRNWWWQRSCSRLSSMGRRASIGFVHQNRTPCHSAGGASADRNPESKRRCTPAPARLNRIELDSSVGFPRLVHSGKRHYSPIAQSQHCGIPAPVRHVLNVGESVRARIENRCLRLSQVEGSYWMVPPSISARPSFRSTMPLQNMSQDSENWLIVCPLTGSNSSAPEPFDWPYGGPDGQPD